VIPAYGAQGSAIDSYNWSGARVTNDIPEMKYPNQQYFRLVRATWKVPTVGSRPFEKDVRSAAWIGLDGGTWGFLPDKSFVPVLQAGTYHELIGGTSTYSAFFGFDTGDPGLDLQKTDLYSMFYRFTVQPSDTMVVVLTYIPGTSTGQATADFTGSTSAPSGPSAAQFTISGIPDQTDLGKTIKGDTAEWVFERLSKDNDSSRSKDYRNKYYNLGTHDQVYFNEAMAQTDALKWISPDQGDSIVMRDVDHWPNLLTAGTALYEQVEIKQRR
jgi:hypothetical protein